MRGVRFTIAATGASMLLQAATLIVMARLLTPSDYGLVAAALIFILPIQTMFMSASERAIVLRADMADESISSAFFALLAASICICALLVFLGLLILDGRETQFGRVLACLSLTLVIGSMNLPARASLRYQLAFDKIGICDVVAQVIGTGGVGILCALNHFGPYSLVFATLSQNIVQTVLYWSLSGSKVVFRVDFAYVRSFTLLAYRVVRISFLDTIQSQLLFIFTWFFSGHAVLGVLNRAYYIIQLPTQLLVNALTNVLFTGFALVKNERDRLISAMRALVRVSSVVIFPLTAGMAMAAPELVQVVLGPKWISAEAFVPWLAIGTAFIMSGHLFAVLAESVGRLRAKFVVQTCTTVAALGFYLALARFGSFGSVAAFAFSWAVYFVAQLALGAWILRLPVTQVAQWMMPGGAGAIAVGVCIACLHIIVRPFQSAALLLALEIPASALVLFVVLRLLSPDLVTDIMAFSGMDALRRTLLTRAD